VLDVTIALVAFPHGFIQVFKLVVLNQSKNPIAVQAALSRWSTIIIFPLTVVSFNDTITHNMEACKSFLIKKVAHGS
jgi:hypothetical protein